MVKVKIKPLTILRRTETILLVALFLTMVSLFFLSIITREIGGTFASKFAWIEEAVRLMNIFLVFFALGLALERGRHVGIDTVRNMMPDRVRRIILKLVDVTGLAFSIYVAFIGYGLVKFVLMTGQRSPTLDIPMGWIYMAPVIGFSLLGLRYALSLFGALDRFKHMPDRDDMSDAKNFPDAEEN